MLAYTSPQVPSVRSDEGSKQIFHPWAGQQFCIFTPSTSEGRPERWPPALSAWTGIELSMALGRGRLSPTLQNGAQGQLLSTMSFTRTIGWTDRMLVNQSFVVSPRCYRNLASCLLPTSTEVAQGARGYRRQGKNTRNINTLSIQTSRGTRKVKRNQ